MHQTLDTNIARPGAKEYEAKNSAIFSNTDLLEQRLMQRLLGIIIIWILGWTPFALIAVAQLSGEA